MSSDVPHSDLAVVVRDLGKCYQVYDRPQDRLRQALLRWTGRQYYREFWALRHVNLEIRRGECVGIIGRNGSGKSTLLQIMAGTLQPSEGHAVTYGRVAAILELGSGFNAEFTGRENVAINAAILGIPADQLEARFNEIVAFSEIGAFIDQPIKTYSSGMIVRLAFAVQALLDPDVLIVDEALAVGDEAFQRKCYAWLERFRARGGTVLFVTHSAQLVVQLCDRAVLMEHGRMLAQGPSKPVVDLYQKLLYGTPQQGEALRRRLHELGGQIPKEGLAEPDDASKTEADAPAKAHEPESTEERVAFFDASVIRPPESTYGTGDAQITDVGMLDMQGRPVNVLVSGQPCVWRYRVRFDADAEGVRFGMMIKTKEGVDIAGISSGHLHVPVERMEAGQEVEVRFELTLNLAPGTYFLNSGVSAIRDNQEVYLHRRVDVAAIRVIPRDERDIYGLAYLDPKMSYVCLNRGVLSHG